MLIIWRAERWTGYSWQNRHLWASRWLLPIVFVPLSSAVFVIAPHCVCAAFPLPEHNAADLAEVIPCSVIRNIGNSGWAPIAPRGRSGPPRFQVLGAWPMTIDTVAVRIKLEEGSVIKHVMQGVAMACHRYPICWRTTFQFHCSLLNLRAELLILEWFSCMSTSKLRIRICKTPCLHVSHKWTEELNRSTDLHSLTFV